MVNTPEAAAVLVVPCRYPPLGERSNYASPVYVARRSATGFRLVTIAIHSGLFGDAAGGTVDGVWGHAA